MEMKRDAKGPRINANCVVGLLRQEWAHLGTFYDLSPQSKRAKLSNFAIGIVSGLTAEDLEDIAEGRATLEGVTPGPITFRRL